MDIRVDLFADSNGAPAIVGTAKLSGAVVTNSNALCRTLHVHALTSTSVADPSPFRSVQVHEDFSSRSYPYPFYCGDKSKIPSTLGNMCQSGYNARGTHAMIPRSAVPPSIKILSPQADVERRVTLVLTAPNEGAIVTTGTAMRATKFDVAHYRHKNVLLRVNQTNKSEIALRDIRDAHGPFLVQSLCAHVFERARGTLSVTTPTANRSEACEGTPSATPRVFREAAS